jgi:hypothetical protein
MPAEKTDLIVDIHRLPPGLTEWGGWIAGLGIRVETVESHPIADCVILRDCEGVPEELPEWLRRRDD